MKIEDQVCSIDLAIKLKKLGVIKPSVFFYEWTGAEEVNIWNDLQADFCEDNIAAYSVAELGEMFPPGFNAVKLPNGWELNFIQDKISKWLIDATEAKTEADARAKMLIHLIEHHLINF